MNTQIIVNGLSIDLSQDPFCLPNWCRATITDGDNTMYLTLHPKELKMIASFIYEFSKHIRPEDR